MSPRSAVWSWRRGVSECGETDRWLQRCLLPGRRPLASSLLSKLRLQLQDPEQVLVWVQEGSSSGYRHKQGVPIPQNVTHASDIVSTPSTSNPMLRMNVGDMDAEGETCLLHGHHRLTFGGILFDEKVGGRFCSDASVQRVRIREKKRLILFLGRKPRIRALATWALVRFTSGEYLGGFQR